MGWLDSIWGAGKAAAGRAEPQLPGAPAPADLPLRRVLEAVAGAPLTPAELAGQLGSTEAALGGMLLTLQRGGYVAYAVPAQGACACGPCALKSLCRNAAAEEGSAGGGAAATLNASALPLLRLTPKGERARNVYLTSFTRLP